MSAPIVYRSEGFELPGVQRNLIRWTIYLGFAALAVGVVNGLDQALSYAGINIFRFYPEMRTYYQGLTVHGVFNAIVLTFAFGNGFISLTTARALGRALSTPIQVAAFAAIAVGTVLAAFAMFTGEATVLYTFYPPLEASWTFYLGLALIVISTWLVSADLFLSLARWRREHPGERIPLLAYMSVVTYLMWDLASLGIAAEVVLLLLPWSLGLLPGSDPMLSRTLFWLTGHPIVYFWLLPVYVSWYGMIPRQVGGKLFSDSVTRIAFLAFLLLIPVGFHHQFLDPGISPTLKYFIAVLTFAIFFPSLMTAFAVMYALEIGGRSHGGKGLIGWFFRIPWRDPSVSAQVLAMLAFMLGGISGLMNASYSMNMMIHNTTFVSGHFHLTVATAVTLSYMGIAYWLVPYLEQKELWGRTLARWQSWIYFVGVLIFSTGLTIGGFAGMPRRTPIALISYPKLPEWQLAGLLAAVGGSLMFIGAVLFFVILAVTILAGQHEAVADIPLSETVERPTLAGWAVRLDRLGLWLGVSLVLVLIVYGSFIAHHLPPHLISQPFKAF